MAKPSPNLIPLPIDERLGDILTSLEQNPALVLISPPGTGKTTRVPPSLLDAPWMEGKKCVILEPRRVAARGAAQRVAYETGGKVGELAGYRVRLDRKESESTRILFITEGIMTSLIQRDPFLEGVGAVILDEFHERSLESDLALGMLREVREGARPDLRIIVASATLDGGPVAEYLDAEVIKLEEPGYPVEVEHLKAPSREPVEKLTAAGVKSAWLKRPGGSGDLLAFLPGAGEIRRTARELEGWGNRLGIEVLTLHSNLSPSAQERALTTGESDRVILSTNVAESSVTIPSLTAVVDSGLVKTLISDPTTLIDRLETVQASRHSAAQRSGRAGRTGPGYALRLWTKHEDLSRPERAEPEVRRVDLSRALLEIIAWGHSDPESFKWFETPEPHRVKRAVALLSSLGLTAPGGGLTAMGKRAATLPLSPRLSRLIIEAERLGAGEEGALACALLEEREIMLSGRIDGPSGMATSHRCDVEHRIELVEECAKRRFDHAFCRALGVDAGRARRVHLQARTLARKVMTDASGAEKDALSRAIFSSFPERAAKRRSPSSDRFLLAEGGGAKLDPQSGVIRSEYVTAVSLTGGARGEGREAIIRIASPIDPAWLMESGEVIERTLHSWDSERGRVVASRIIAYRALTLSEERVAPDPSKASPILASELLKDPLRLLAPPNRALALIERINFLSKLLPGEIRQFEWEPFIENICICKSSLDVVKGVDLYSAILSALPYEEQTLLRSEAPESISLASGRKATLDYSGEAGPVVEGKLQEFFSMRELPRVAKGRARVVAQLLSPAGRPLQVTSDLAAFWENSYPEVRKEMRGRYPKHNWPEDPLGATASTRTTKPKK
ncbi:MAG: ATP-dependent helicase HrpB [Deltaproteobacteria bacterium]|nr:MAG: ATP-dependent helicase HrpB [Deltaproteobacteria bacterium]